MLYFRYLFTLLPFDFLRSVYAYSLFPAGSPLRKSTLKRIRNLSLKQKKRLQCLVQLLIPARSSPLRSLKITGPSIIYWMRNLLPSRSEERRVGKESGSTFRTRVSSVHLKKKK